jgi:hypothetical protein
MCLLEITTRTCTSPKRFGKSAPVKVPFRTADAEGDGEGVADGEVDGLGELPTVWVGDTGAIAVNWCAVTL